VDGLVTVAANNEGLALPGRHDAYPGRLLGPSFRLQVGEFADVVDFAVDRRATEFARPREEALDQLVASDVDVGRVAIYVCTLREKQAMTLPFCSTSLTAHGG